MYFTAPKYDCNGTGSHKQRSYIYRTSSGVAGEGTEGDPRAAASHAGALVGLRARATLGGLGLDGVFSAQIEGKGA